MSQKNIHYVSLVQAIKNDDLKAMQNILTDEGLLPVIDDYWNAYKLLIQAVVYQREAMVKLLLNSGCRVQQEPKGRYCHSHLYYAITTNNTEIAKILVKRGPTDLDFFDFNKNGETILFIAVRNKNTEMVKLLLSVSNAKSICHTNNDGFTALHVACTQGESSIVQSFLNHANCINSSVAFDAIECTGYTPLHLAVYYKHENIVKLLLSHGADVHKKNGAGISPLHLACSYNIKSIVNSFFDTCNKEKSSLNVIYNSICDNGAFTILHAACVANNEIKVNKLLDCGYDINNAIDCTHWRGYTPLHLAVAFKNVRIVKLLLNRNANVNAKARTLTPLHIACSKEYKCFLDERELLRCKKPQIEIVKLLLNYGAIVNARDCWGKTPIYYVFEGHVNDTKLLLNEVHQELFTLLIQEGADINVCDRDGQTVLHTIMRHQKHMSLSDIKYVIKLIVSEGANMNDRSDDGKTVYEEFSNLNAKRLKDAVSILLKNHADVNVQDDSGRSPLHIACEKMYFLEAVMLLNHGADINIEDKEGRTPLFYVYRKSKRETYSMLFNDEIGNCIKKVLIHAYRMRILGRFVSANDKLWPNLSQKLEMLSSPESMKRYEDNCKSELEKMKLVKIDRYTSLYDILLKSTHKMGVHVKNDKLKKTKDDFKNEYPIYGALLGEQVQKGLKRDLLLKPVRAHFQLRIYSLPEPCTEKICQYLDDNCLRNLYEAIR